MADDRLAMIFLTVSADGDPATMVHQRGWAIPAQSSEAFAQAMTERYGPPSVESMATNGLLESPVADLDTNFRRLAARGTFRIQPSSEYVPAGTEVRDGKIWQVSVPRFRVSLAWWPLGQGPGRKDGFGNPFCQRGFLGATVAEVVEKAVEATRPQSWSLESLVSHMLYERAKKRRQVASG